MEKIIRAAVERGASDLHIKAGDVFRARINGKLVPLTKQRLTPDQTRQIALKLLATDGDRSRLDLLRDFDCSWGMPGVGRFRVNVLRQRSSFMIVMRVIPFTIPTIESLRLPPVAGRLAELEQGLVLVTGVSGSGKSSTMAAMINHMNQQTHRHIITIENPIEFLHRDVQCSVTQREVGVDTASFAFGLQAALRQDPDVIVIGEIGDPETLDTAVKAAERGHLVLSTLPSSDAVHALSRLYSMLPGPEREIGLVRLSEMLRGIVAQRLLPRQGGDGRIVAVEALIPTPAIKQILRDPERVGTLRSMMADGGAAGMQTFAQHAARLLETGEIGPEAAQALGG